jgi:hypothetical protein
MIQGHQLLQTETAARAALSSGSWDEARRLLATYCRQVEERLRALPTDGAEARQLAGQVVHLLGWAHTMALTGQAHLAEQIRQLPSLSGYASPASADVMQTWRLEA